MRHFSPVGWALSPARQLGAAKIQVQGISCCAGHYCGSQASQLGRTIDCFPPLTTCITPSSTMKARPQKGGFDVRSSANLLSAVNCVVSSAIGTLTSTSQRQPRATAIACSVVFL